MRNRIAEAIQFILFFSVLLAGVYLYFENLELSSSLAKRDASILSLKQENAFKDKEYTKSIDSLSMLVNGSSYKIGGKKMTVSEIIKTANQWAEDRDKYKYERDYYKSAYDSTYEDYVSFHKLYLNENKVRVKDLRSLINSYETLKKYPPEKYREYEFFHQQLKKHHGISYEVVNNSDSTRTLSIVWGGKLDTAMSLYRNFKEGGRMININLKEPIKRKKASN